MFAALVQVLARADLLGAAGVGAAEGSSVLGGDAGGDPLVETSGADGDLVLAEFGGCGTWEVVLGLFFSAAGAEMRTSHGGGGIGGGGSRRVRLIPCGDHFASGRASM